MNACQPAFSLVYALIVVGIAAAGYLVGSIPVAWLLTRLVSGRDLRSLGSGNVGVMNAAVSTARWVGLLVFLSEIGKGSLAVIVPRLLGCGDELVGLAVIAVVCGTRFPVWLRFKGGRGNTAGLSALFLISWQVLAYLLAVWILARLLTSSSFKATRLVLLVVPFAAGFSTRSWVFGVTGFILALIYLEAQRVKSDDHLIIKHRWNGIWGFLTSPIRRHSPTHRN